jgi:hypothetical protein
MKRFGLVVCLALCALLVLPAAYARRNDAINPKLQQQYTQGLTLGSQQPAAKMTFKGSSPCNCTGRWKTNWGEMTLTQTANNKVTGQYTHDNGKIEGTIYGNSFSGRWSESPTYQDPNDGGLVELNFRPDCMSFTGRWKYGTSGDWKENNWTGEKISGAEKLPQ